MDSYLSGIGLLWLLTKECAHSMSIILLCYIRSERTQGHVQLFN